MTMSRALVDRALAAASDTRHLTVAAGALTGVPATFSRAFGTGPAVVVADPTTWQVWSRSIKDSGLTGDQVDQLSATNYEHDTIGDTPLVRWA